MKLLLVFLFTFVSLLGCASVKTLQATGGSRADGIVEMSYEYGMFEKPDVQWNQGQITAAERCKAWGYGSAELFGGTTSKCQSSNGQGNCLRYLVTAKYQCVNPQK